ncbi:MAG: hypothetical protein A2189_04315 [Paenibacillus sp. RIFOXYA1_FULL_44_5]|nr:MAG: hypothetical protein A2189_04315 [Paenibacillus sp. RIFOXYA1_FULL_44_5]
MNKKFMTLLLSFGFMLSFLTFSPQIDAFVQAVKTNSDLDSAKSVFSWDAGAAQTANEQRLLDRIEKAAAESYIPPVDAQIDSVWKAIPGYNGREVDVEKTYKLMKQKKNQDKLVFIYREVSPKVSLNDLPPNPIFKGNPNKKMVALMINVAWGNEYLPMMLDVLKKENVHATFFFDGSWLKKNVALAKMIQKNGHELSNHAYSHKNMSQLNRTQAVQEIVKTQQLLKTELNVDNTLFAPPSGDYNQATVNIANELHLKTILWTLDTVDWRNPSPGSIVQKITTRVEPGTMILMHPTSSSSQALLQIIQAIKGKGLLLGTVSELISSTRIPDVETNLKF